MKVDDKKHCERETKIITFFPYIVPSGSRGRGKKGKRKGEISLAYTSRCIIHNFCVLSKTTLMVEKKGIFTG